MLHASVAAKRSLFSQPKLSKVYPDVNASTTEAAAAAVATAESEESAYQSGSASPDDANVAASTSRQSVSAGNRCSLGCSQAPRKCVHFAGSEAVESPTVSSPAASPALSSKSSTPSHFHIVTVSERVDIGSQQARQRTSLDLLSLSSLSAASSATGSRRYSVLDTLRLPPLPVPTDMLSPDEEQEILETSGEDFKERLKRLFGVRNSIASPTHHMQDRGSSPDLKQPGPPPGQRSRRPSLAARLFNKLPFVRKDEDDTGGDDADEASTSGTGGGGIGGSVSTRYCEICGEPDCEQHASLSDMDCCQRHLALLGCYQTKEDRERSLMLENNSAARITTLIVVIVFLGLICALIALSVLSKSSGSSAATTASSLSAVITATTASYRLTTT